MMTEILTALWLFYIIGFLISVVMFTLVAIDDHSTMGSLGKLIRILLYSLFWPAVVILCLRD